MNIRFTKSRRWFVAALLLTSAVIALMGPSFSARLRGVASTVMAPFGDGGMYLATKIESHRKKLGQRAISPGQARRLAQANDELRGRLHVVESQLQQFIRRSIEADSLFGRVPYGQWKPIAALVVGRDALSYGQMRSVNAGKLRGAADGVPVTTRKLLTDRSKALPHALAAVSASAVVGRIVTAGEYTATLQLVTDRDYSVSAKIRRIIDPNNPRTITSSGETTIARPITAADGLIAVLAGGDGAGGMIVADVSAYDSVQIGDWLETSDDGNLPAGIRIGTVSEVTEDLQRFGLFVRLKITPFADLETLREVYIVLPAAAKPIGEGW